MTILFEKVTVHPTLQRGLMTRIKFVNVGVTWSLCRKSAGRFEIAYTAVALECAHWPVAVLATICWAVASTAMTGAPGAK